MVKVLCNEEDLKRAKELYERTRGWDREGIILQIADEIAKAKDETRGDMLKLEHRPTAEGVDKRRQLSMDNVVRAEEVWVECRIHSVRRTPIGIIAKALQEAEDRGRAGP